MKRKALFVFFTLSFIYVNGQEYYDQEMYASDNVYVTNYDLPLVRPINGGTKIIPIYVDGQNSAEEWERHEDIRNAFGYACKIWEEAMPTTFPIRIRVKLDSQRSIVGNNYSKIQSRAVGDVYGTPFSNAAYVTQMKAVSYAEMIGLYNSRIFWSDLDTAMFVEPEIAITYFNRNNWLENNCVFSINASDVDNQHYDFVTMVLRDLAKAFGANWKFPAVNNSLRIVTGLITPFERNILNSMGTFDPQEAYVKGTQGTLDLGSYSLFAPQVWDNTRSLNCFIPNNNSKITKLLGYNVGKGTLIRDISDDSIIDFFEYLLRWEGDVAVGIGYPSVSSSLIPGSTSGILPFKGNFSINIPQYSDSRNSDSQLALSAPLKKTINRMDYQLSNLERMMRQFHPNYSSYDNSIDGDGWTVAILKKDGTWDEVYHFPFMSNTLEADYSSLEFHYDKSEYARSCDGYLRCRVSRYYNRKGCTQYYLLDELPQKVRIGRLNAIQATYDDDEYIKDVKIPLSDLEGTKRVVVYQWNEGETYPDIYEISDFKKGYFITTVDKELYTRFEIRAYNDNGYTTSERTCAPLEPYGLTNVQFKMEDGYIEVLPNSNRLIGKDIMASVEIVPLNETIGSRQLNYTVINGCKVDVKCLPSGMYALTVYDTKGGRHAFKFCK
jgi:hypothetical protein